MFLVRTSDRRIVGGGVGVDIVVSVRGKMMRQLPVSVLEAQKRPEWRRVQITAQSS